jgi:hypothetical protein
MTEKKERGWTIELPTYLGEPARVSLERVAGKIRINIVAADCNVDCVGECTGQCYGAPIDQRLIAPECVGECTGECIAMPTVRRLVAADCNVDCVGECTGQCYGAPSAQSIQELGKRIENIAQNVDNRFGQIAEIIESLKKAK